jgi:hypothetical protein
MVCLMVCPLLLHHSTITIVHMAALVSEIMDTTSYLPQQTSLFILLNIRLLTYHTLVYTGCSTTNIPFYIIEYSSTDLSHTGIYRLSQEECVKTLGGCSLW